MSTSFAGIEPFVAVAEAGSFRAAAEQIGVSAAAVSKSVARLEAELGVVLLHRTTRRVSLSPEGRLFLPRAREALAQLRAGRDLLELAGRGAEGELTLSLPHIVSGTVARAMPAFLARYPGLRLRLRLTDRYVKLVDEEVDLAVRIGELSDSSLIARRLLDTRWTTFASPSYLAGAAPLDRLEDLVHHRCLVFRGPRGRHTRWQFQVDGKAQAILPEVGVELDHGGALVEAALAGAGVVQGPDFLVQEHLRAGRLVEVLAELQAPGPPVHALWLPSRRRHPRIRAGLELLSEALGAR